ncbi:MAG: hypothetical protein VR72_17320 [Clostridiaceae bacterium BRH_c20a]|nr:MAG: hypothetical protein VR72_17320 [Clostridiaceae bacterium BRH_c20a]
MKINVTQRVQNLRERLISYKPSLCSERAVLITQSYQETEGEPMVIRRAKALKNILDNMTIYINEEELIIGNQAIKPRSAPVFPEFGTSWLEKELDTFNTRVQDKMLVCDKAKKNIQNILPYWKGLTIKEKLFKMLPESVIRVRKAKIFTLDNHEEGGLGHVLPDYKTILETGLNGIKEQAQKKINCANIADSNEFKNVLFWEAIKIVSDAVIGFSWRFSKLAKNLADQEVNFQRKTELIRISEVCSKIPANPAKSFDEAIQCCWFLQLVIQIETNGTAISPGRLDQILFPYYYNDFLKGEITNEKTQELIDCFWLKLNELIKLRSNEGSYVHAGFPMNQNLVIGGQNENGEDVTNELTYMFLNAQEHIHLSQPQFSLRVHQNTPNELLLRAAEIIGLGGGIPQLLSDEILIPSLIHRGIPLKLARNYSPIGCVEVGVIGLWGRGNGGYFNIPKVLELALNNGRDRLTGEKISIETGTNFNDFNAVLIAFQKQLAYCIKLLAVENNLIDMLHGELVPHVFISLVVPGCIEKGKDVTEGGALYNWTNPLGVGLANVADSLAAIKKKIFEEKLFNIEELLEALDCNFEDKKYIQKALQDAPKYGNDNDEVDLMARLVANLFIDEIEKYQTPRGGIMGPASLFSLSVSLPFGWATGATPDGRKAKTPLADGISPTHGNDVNGPTAVLKSASKLDHIRTSGSILNQKFHPTVFASSRDLIKFVELIRTYLLDLKGSHIQINVVSADTLRQAQKEPGKYRDLVIRVTGYSAFFTELSKEVQDDIIGRTEHQAI